MHTAYLKTPTLLPKAPHKNTSSVGAAPDSRSVRGRRGIRMVFSCTWNEKRKNDIEQVRSA
jgi:hypothetical protein